MAAACIREYADVAVTWGGKVVQAGAEPALADQAVTTGAGSVEKTLSANTRMIAVSTAAAQAHCIAFSPTPGAAATATTNNLRLPANNVFFFGVRPGDHVALIDVA